MACIPSNLVLLELGPHSKRRGALAQRGRQRPRVNCKSKRMNLDEGGAGRKKKNKKKKEGHTLKDEKGRGKREERRGGV